VTRRARRSPRRALRPRMRTGQADLRLRPLAGPNLASGRGFPACPDALQTKTRCRSASLFGEYAQHRTTRRRF
jgi:hypothetical protein